jgi:large subunit ribosomal protein L19e
MQTGKVKEIAAGLLKIGHTKVWVKPGEETRLKEAMTKEDVRTLISEGLVKVRKANEQSRGRTRKLLAKKKKGRKKGAGKKKGKETARRKLKKEWISNVRSQRRKLAELRTEAKEAGIYSVAYQRVKGSYFRGRKHLEEFIKGGK